MKHRDSFIGRPTAFALACVFSASSPALAQIDTSILDLPWQPGSHWAETLDKLAFVPSAEADRPGAEGDSDVNTFYWDSTGRIRTQRDDANPNLVLGYRMLTVGIHGIDDQPPPIGSNGIVGVPDDLNDVALVAGYRFDSGDNHPIENDWRVTLLGGAGTANDGHWMNSDALYGIAAIDFSTQLDAERTLHLGLGYYGNRTYLHNLPLPDVRFTDQIGRDLSYTLGFPRCAFEWRPLGELTIDGEWSLWSRTRLGASMPLDQKWSIFAEYEETTDGFFINEAGNDRLFFQFSRAMAGARWKGKWVDAQFGVGYAFSQDLSVGDEFDDASGIGNDIGGGMMIMLNLRGTF